MKDLIKNKILVSVISLALIAASALSFTACSSENGKTDVTTIAETTAETTEATTAETTAAETTAEAAETQSAEATDVGEGATSFLFEVTDKDGNVTRFNVSTDKTKVGEALLDAKLIEGDESEYGLFVKRVNGITADYDVDGTYWAFYVNGEYALTGVDATDIAADTAYAFKVEK